MPTKTDVVQNLHDTRDQIIAVAESIPAGSWAATVYENGWNARQLLHHIASTSGVAGFVLQMSKLPPPPPGGEPFDNDAFNRSQVALREGNSSEDALNEVRANIQRDIQAIEAAPDAHLQRTWTAPWGNTNTVAAIIIDSMRGHLGTHVAELRAAVA
jgi:hypothetical protein